jgi:hypothetical protein
MTEELCLDMEILDGATGERAKISQTLSGRHLVSAGYVESVLRHMAIEIKELCAAPARDGGGK